MTNVRKAVLKLTILLITAAPLTLAQGTYTQFDVPGAVFTIGYAIDASGDVVGIYGNSDGTFDGFLLSGDIYTPVVYPGSSDTRLSGINDVGQIVGESIGPNIGFLYEVQTQTFTP